MIVDVVEGDLVKLALKGKYDAIVHGCNCHHKMNSGIARTIREVFPEAYEADCAQTIKSDRSKLGSYSHANIQYEYKRGDGEIMHDMLTIINAYTQFDYGTDKMNVDYDAIRKVFTKINEDYADMNIGIPMIGAGLAGGDWNIISSIINKVTPKLDIHLVEFGSKA